MSERLILPPGVNEIGNYDIAVSDRYLDTLRGLIYKQSKGVTQFYGGPLHLGPSAEEDRGEVWLSPVEVDDGEAYSYFQVLYLNMRPEEFEEEPTVPVTYLYVDEATHKLKGENHEHYQELTEYLYRPEKGVIIRPATTGMAYYPRVVTPEQSPELIDRHMEHLARALNLRDPSADLLLSQATDQGLQSPEIDGIRILHARMENFGDSNVYSYGFTLEDDPWKYYEIFSPKLLDDISHDNLLVRVDSGCDIGQIYDDKGCDCREQLHTALDAVQQEGDGIIIHVPSQDGRGYGAATKMETESLKRGIVGMTNPGDLTKYDTVTAAVKILGKEVYDIRSYNGASRILKALGIRSVVLQTDNRKKVAGLASAGITVTRKKTGTEGRRGAATHIQAKHNTDDYEAQ